MKNFQQIRKAFHEEGYDIPEDAKIISVEEWLEGYDASIPARHLSPLPCTDTSCQYRYILRRHKDGTVELYARWGVDLSEEPQLTADIDIDGKCFRFDAENRWLVVSETGADTEVPCFVPANWNGDLLGDCEFLDESEIIEPSGDGLHILLWDEGENVFVDAIAYEDNNGELAWAAVSYFENDEWHDEGGSIYGGLPVDIPSGEVFGDLSDAINWKEGGADA